MFTLYENIEITDSKPSKGIEDVWASIQASKFKSIIVGAVYKHPNTNPDCNAYLEIMLQTYNNCGKNMYMVGDLNEDLLNVSRLEQILNKINLYQLIKEPTRITPRSKTLIDVIITNNGDSVIHAETSLSTTDHHAVSCTINPESKELHHFKSAAEIMPIIPLKIFKLNLCTSLIN